MKYVRNSLHLLAIATLTLSVAARWPSPYQARQQVNGREPAAGEADGTYSPGSDQWTQNRTSSDSTSYTPGPRPVSSLDPSSHNHNWRISNPGYCFPVMNPECSQFDQHCCPSFCPCPCPCPCPEILPIPETSSCCPMNLDDPCHCVAPVPPCFCCEGGLSSQPNIITQSVSLCPTKRPCPAYNGSSTNFHTFSNSLHDSADGNCDDDPAPCATQTRIFPSRIRDGRRKSFWPAARDNEEYAGDDENTLEMVKVNRIIEMLDRLKAKEDDCDDHPRRAPSFGRLRPKSRYLDPEEEEEDEREAYDDEVDPESFEQRKIGSIKRRMNRYRKYDEEPDSEYVPRKSPKLDWLMLKSKKSPKRYSLAEDEPEKRCSRQMMKYAVAADDDDEDDDRYDSLIVPERTRSHRHRRFD